MKDAGFRKVWRDGRVKTDVIDAKSSGMRFASGFHRADIDPT